MNRQHVARELVKLARELMAGCEKLPEGPMRENCEKKKEKKSRDLMSSGGWIKEWRRGNDRGDGYEAGNESDSPVRAAIREGWDVIEEDITGNVLAMRPGGGMVVIADLNGPWAVDVSNRWRP
jgi:hypothetical protein